VARTRRHAVVKAYLDAYRKLVVGEPVTDHVVRDSIVLSVPLHFSGDHRVEVTVTQYSPGKFILSDMARTLGELEEGGRSVTSDFRKRAKEIARSFGVSFRIDHMILDCGEKELGQQIQRFAEAAKTIGDAYLLQRTRTTHVRKVIDDVKDILAAHHLPFEANKVVDGQLDKSKRK
jgi:hypothetical protein